MDINYDMGDTVLDTTVKERISADIKFQNSGIAASNGNQVLGLIRRNITYKDKR